MKDNDNSSPVEVFAGNQFEANMVKNLLENEGIEAFVLDEFIGTISPWVASGGGAGAVKVIVKEEDKDIATQIVEKYNQDQDDKSENAYEWNYEETQNNKLSSALLSYINETISKHSNISHLGDNIVNAINAIIRCYENDGKVLACGNGGSSADAEHLAGELMKGFEKPRPLSQDLKTKLYNISGNDTLGNKLNKGLPAISLNTHTSLMTAIVNDIGGDYIFAQQVIGYGKPGDVLILFSTSGNSKNIVNAAMAAKAMDINVICITGKTGGAVKEVCDILINIDETNTANIQEATIIIYHLICRVVENYFFS